jgi:hypothetical protein
MLVEHASLEARRSRTLEHSGLSMGAGRLADKRGPQGLAFLFFFVSVAGSIYPSLWGISCSRRPSAARLAHACALHLLCRDAGFLQSA